MKPRIEPLTADQLDADARAAFRSGMPGAAERFLSDAPDTPPIPTVLGVLLNHPRVAGPWLTFNNTLLGQPMIEPRQRELLIMRIAWHARAEYEFLQHVRLAKQLGVTDDEVEAVTRGPDAGAWSAIEADLLRAADELFEDACIGDATWARLSEHFDTAQMMEIAFVVGTYLCLAYVLNSAGVQLDEDLDPAIAPAVPQRPSR
jgi:alkylhydroperoxidase family enzyme